jgi:hypothetical protein
MGFMQSGSQSDSSPDRPTNHFPEIIGVFIALLTLMLPLTVIAHYSSQPSIPDGPIYPTATGKSLE